MMCDYEDNSYFTNSARGLDFKSTFKISFVVQREIVGVILTITI